MVKSDKKLEKDLSELRVLREWCNDHKNLEALTIWPRQEVTCIILSRNLFDVYHIVQVNNLRKGKGSSIQFEF